MNHADPSAPGRVSADGLQFGVTAYSEADAWRIVDERGDDQHHRAAVVEVKSIETVD